MDAYFFDEIHTTACLFQKYVGGYSVVAVLSRIPSPFAIDRNQILRSPREVITWRVSSFRSYFIAALISGFSRFEFRSRRDFPRSRTIGRQFFRISNCRFQIRTVNFSHRSFVHRIASSDRSVQWRKLIFTPRRLTRGVTSKWKKSRYIII